MLPPGSLLRRPAGAIPQGVPQIDRNDSINNALQFLTLIPPQTGFDFAAARTWSTTNVTGAQSPVGLLSSFDGATSVLQFASGLPIPQQGFAASFWFVLTSLGVWALLDDFDGSGVLIGIQAFTLGTGAIGFRVGGNSTGTNYIGRQTAASVTATNILYHCVLNWTGGSTDAACQIWLNGAQVDSTNDDGGGAFSQAANFGQLNFGAQNGGSGLGAFLPGSAGLLRFIGRSLSQAEIMRLYREPYAGLLYPSDQIFLTFPAGTVTPSDFDWDWNPQYPIRRRPIPPRDASEDAVWAQSGPAIPTALGWDWNEQHPVRRKLPPARTSDSREEDAIWPRTVTAVDQNLDFDWNPQFPIRPRPRPPNEFDSKESEAWPFTATKTDTKFGWDWPPQFPVRRRARLLSIIDEVLKAPPPPPLVPWGYDPDPNFPSFIRRSPVRAWDSKEEEAWPFTSTKVDTKFGWNIEPQFQVAVRRHPQHIQFDPDLPPPQFAAIIQLGIVPELVPYDYNFSRGWLLRTAKAVNQLLRGNIGSTLTITLAAHASSSTFTDNRITPSTHISLSPQTASAAVALASGQLFILTAAGSATIFHPVTGDTDKTFSAAILR